MTLQAGEFLRNIRAVREIDDFFLQSVILQSQLRQPSGFDPLEQLLAITGRYLWSLLLDMVDCLAHRVDSSDQILREVGTFPLAHTQHLCERLTQSLVHSRPKVLF